MRAYIVRYKTGTLYLVAIREGKEKYYCITNTDYPFLDHKKMKKISEEFDVR